MPWNNAFLGLGILFLLLVAFLIWMRLDGQWLSFLAAVVCLLFGNLDRIESFKASPTGIEAQTREVIREAKGAIRELQLVAKIFSQLFVTMMHAEGRLGGGIRDKQVEAFTE